jgi:hypothetical protein
MRRTSWVVLVASVLAGAVLARFAPRAWSIGPVQGLLVGAALYFGALRRYLADGGSMPGVLLRGTAFLAVIAALAYLCFVAMPRVDVRAGFVILSAWLIARSVSGSGARRSRPA